MLHGHPQEVLQIGFGSGATTWAIRRHDVKEVDVVDLISGVAKPANYFLGINQGVSDDKRVPPSGSL